MRFYMVAKCIDGQNEDLAINLENMTFEKIKIDEEVVEDKSYVLANGQIIELRDQDFKLKNLYLEAFGKSRRIKRGNFRFIRMHRNSNIYINDNYFLFNGEKLVGKIVNSHEIDQVDSKGIEKFNKLLKRLLLNDIVVLIKGKKVYRIFTYAKLNSIINDSNQIDIFEFLNKNHTNQLLIKLKAKIDDAYKSIDEARRQVDEELNKENEK